MTDDKLHAKLAKLKVLADAAQGKPEGITALAMFQKLLKKYGVTKTIFPQNVTKRKSIRLSYLNPGALKAGLFILRRCLRHISGALRRVPDLGTEQGFFTMALSAIWK